MQLEKPMTEYKPYRKTAIAWLAPWTPDTEMTGVSVSDEDRENGSPKVGDMISRNPDHHADRYLMAEKFFRESYEPVD